MAKSKLLGYAVELPETVGEWHLYRVGRLFSVTLTNGRKVRDCYVMRSRISGDWYYRDCLPWELPDEVSSAAGSVSP